jgi:hypothetical protein
MVSNKIQVGQSIIQYVFIQQTKASVTLMYAKNHVTSVLATLPNVANIKNACFWQVFPGHGFFEFPWRFKNVLVCEYPGTCDCQHAC